MVHGHRVTYCTHRCTQDDEVLLYWCSECSVPATFTTLVTTASDIISLQDTSSWKIQCGCWCWNLSCSHDKLHEMFWLGRRMAPHASCIIISPVANPSRAKETHCMSKGLFVNTLYDIWLIWLNIPCILRDTLLTYWYEKTSKLLKQSLVAAATVPRCGGRELVSHRQAAQESYNIIPAAAKHVLTAKTSALHMTSFGHSMNVKCFKNTHIASYPTQKLSPGGLEAASWLQVVPFEERRHIAPQQTVQEHPNSLTIQHNNIDTIIKI